MRLGSQFLLLVLLLCDFLIKKPVSLRATAEMTFTSRLSGTICLSLTFLASRSTLPSAASSWTLPFRVRPNRLTVSWRRSPGSTQRGTQGSSCTEVRGHLCLALVERESYPGLACSSTPDHPYVLAFSLIMLHTDAFNKSNKNKMSKADYMKNTRMDGVLPEVLDVSIFYQPFSRLETCLFLTDNHFRLRPDILR